MRIERSTRWTAFTALATSTIALGVSVWSLGCERNASAEPDPAGARISVASAVPSSPQAAPPSSGVPKADGPAAAPSGAVPGKELGENTAQPPEEKAPDVELVVKRLVVTHAIENREPLATGELIAGKPVVAFLEMANGGADEGQVLVTFEQGPRESVGHIKLGVPGKQSRWRTWGRTERVRTAGEWEVVVSTPDGRELGRKKFVVNEPKQDVAG